MPPDGPEDSPHAKWFLDSLARRTGANPGTKGGLSLWGMVGNNVQGDAFCESLMPFWADLLADDFEGGPSDFNNVVVIAEEEQSGAATAYQISWDDPDKSDRAIVVKKSERLPFTWNQH